MSLAPLKPGGNWRYEFTLEDSSGAPVNYDAGTGKAVVYLAGSPQATTVTIAQATDDAAGTLTGSAGASITGAYQLSFTAGVGWAYDAGLTLLFQCQVGGVTKRRWIGKDKLVQWGAQALPLAPAGQLNGVPILVENDGGVAGVKMVMIADTPVTSSAVVAIDFADTVATRANQTTAQTSLDTLTTRVPSTVHTASQQTTDHAAELTAIDNVPGLVWASGTRTLTSFGTLVSDVAVAVWGSLTSGLTTVGSIGKWILDNLAGLATQASLDDAAAAVEAVNSELIDQGTTLDAALAAAQGAQSNTTSVPGMIVNGAFTAGALANAPTGGGGGGDTLVVAPLVGQVLSPYFTSFGGIVRNLTIPQNSGGVLVIAAKNADGTPYDLTGKALYFAVYDSHGTAVIEYASDTGITVSAGKEGVNNQASVTFDPANTATANANLLYALRVTTDDNAVVAQGKFGITLCPIAAP